VSLIDDALRRAQAAQSPGAGSALRVPMPLPDPSRYRRRYRRRLAAGALLAAVAVAGLLLLARSGFFRPGAPEPGRHADAEAPAAIAARAATRTGTPTATPTPAAEPGTAAAAPSATRPRPTPIPARVPDAASGPAEAPAEPGTGPETEAAPEAAAAAPAPARRERTPLILPPVEVSNASGSPRLAPEARPPRAVPAPVATPRPRTYSGTANLPTTRLELGGIVFSETNPTALINGRVLSPGGYIDGFTVVKIEPDRVELTDDKTTIILTLK
jgi:hypothetical protein